MDGVFQNEHGPAVKKAGFLSTGKGKICDLGVDHIFAAHSLRFSKANVR